MQTRIEQKLRDSFSVVFLEVLNESSKHQGHSGDDGSGESHFSVTLISPDFSDHARVNRQRMVFSALEEEMKTIHALSLDVRPNKKA